jgi:lipopolysaccharide export system permease protein
VKLRRYLAVDVLRHTAAVSVVLLVIIITGRFVKYLAEAASGKLAAEILLPVMLYRLPGFLELLLPLGLFIGILMAYGRLYVESEMVILSACGIGPGRLARFTLWPALLITLLVAGLALLLTPRGAEQSEALLNDPGALQGLQILAAGRFQKRGDDGTVTYARDVDAESGTLIGVFAFRPEAREGDAESDVEGDVEGNTAPIASVLVAERGQILRRGETGLRYLELEDGMRYRGQAGERSFSAVRFLRYGERLPDAPVAINTEPVDARATADLWGSPLAEDRAALHWRFSLIAMVPVIALLALAMSRTNHRRGRYLALAPALLLHLVYLFLLASTRSRVAEAGGEVTEFWLLHGLFFLLALILLFGPGILRRLGR